LKEKCPTDTCGDTSKQQTCKEQCEKYQKFIEPWKTQYLKQSKKYFNIKGIIQNRNVPTNAYEYLHSQLKDRCKNGECNCMKDESKTTSSNHRHTKIGGSIDGSTGNLISESHDTHMPASFDDEPEDVREQCKCALPPSPTTLHSGPGGGGRGGNPQPGGSSAGTPDGGITGGVSGGGSPPSPTSPSPSPSTPGTKQDTKSEKKYIPKPKDPLNCVDEAAYYIGKEAENALDDVKSKLKGNIEPIDSTKENNNFSTNNSCDLKIPFLCKKFGRRKNPCGNKGGNIFNVNTEWQCYRNLSLYKGKKGVCIPPRREHMCTKPLEYMRTGKYSTEELLKVLLHIAAYEGKDINDQWEKIEDGKKKKYELCDAMKYSFADLGDIVRGTDMLFPKGRVPAVEKKLKEVFENIYEKLKNKNDVITNKYPDVSSFRSAWWDANRKHVWEAITFFA
ncbi:putative EMP1-like protein, partial [Plasmodium gaboni]